MELIDNFAKNIELMYNSNIRFLSNLTFKTSTYRKNFDFITNSENIITECEGNVSLLRINEKKSPLIIGEYGFSVWNIRLAKMLNIDIIKLIKDYHDESTYDELLKIVDSGLLEIDKYKKIVLLHSLVVRADYRKRNITEEYVEAIYRDYYDDDVAVLALVKPFQNNENDRDYYYNHKLVNLIRATNQIQAPEKIPASEYYSLDEFNSKEDDEFNEYKLFSVATRCGFNRIGDTYLFKFHPEKIINRMLNKFNITVADNM